VTEVRELPIAEWGKARLGIAAVLVGILLATGGFLAGRLTAGAPDTPGNASAAAGFARDMQVHHNQGVELAFIIRERSTDDAIRLLAYDIATTQAQQSGQMFGWLEAWGLPQASTQPSMAWMLLPVLDEEAEHGHTGAPHEPGEPMPGLVTAEQIDELRSLDGVDAERLFLELMIEHHRGGVEMAEALVARSTNDQAVTLATGIIRSQSGEIDYMQQLLDDREP
jgi:uncharacterized protein (DUF305 family)